MGGPFRVRSRVLVPYQEKFYEAKIIKSEKRADGWFYFVHYPGWEAEYDEWVEEGGLVKFNEELLGVDLTKDSTGLPATILEADAATAAAAADGKDVAAAPAAAAEGAVAAVPAAAASMPGQDPVPEPAPAPTSTQPPAAASAPPRWASQPPAAAPAAAAREPDSADRRRERDRERRKRKRDAALAVAVPDGTALHAEFDLPPGLKLALLNEHQAIVEEGKLLPMPRKPCVEQILARYLAYCSRRHANTEQEQEVAYGVRLYFDAALWQYLLYDQELGQAEEVLGGGAPPSSVYGSEHLLRLLLKMPEYLAQAGVTPVQQTMLETSVMDLVSFVQLHSRSLLADPDEYEEAAD